MLKKEDLEPGLAMAMASPKRPVYRLELVSDHAARDVVPNTVWAAIVDTSYKRLLRQADPAIVKDHIPTLPVWRL